MNPKRILIPIPHQDFDPTETAIPWQVVTQAGHEVVFATPDGRVGQADPMMLSGVGLDPWGWIPLLKHLKIVGFFLRADRNGRRAYQAMLRDKNFQHPLAYDQLNAEDYDGLILPGGHAEGVKTFLESEVLQEFVARFFELRNEKGEGRPVGAICHGVVLAARSVSRDTGRSVLYGKKTTALTWAFEEKAWRITRFFARFWDPHYYRTYLEEHGQEYGHMGVEQEVTRALESPDHFIQVPDDDPHYWKKTSGMVRDTPEKTQSSHVVVDKNYVSARWPGDSHAFAQAFTKLL